MNLVRVTMFEALAFSATKFFLVEGLGDPSLVRLGRMAVRSNLGYHCRSETAGSFETLAQQSFGGLE